MPLDAAFNHKILFAGDLAPNRGFAADETRIFASHQVLLCAGARRKLSLPIPGVNHHGNPKRVPKPSRALAPPGIARPRLRVHGNHRRVPKPSRALAPPGIARLRLRVHGNHRRVPKPSRALAPPGIARLRLRAVSYTHLTL